MQQSWDPKPTSSTVPSQFQLVSLTLPVGALAKNNPAGAQKRKDRDLLEGSGQLARAIIILCTPHSHNLERHVSQSNPVETSRSFLDYLECPEHTYRAPHSALGLLQDC